MIAGVGVDLLAVSRMERRLANTRFMERVFSPEERAYIGAKAERAAGLFCAKEAYAKATGLGLSFRLLREVTVSHLPSGAPVLRAESAAEGERFHLSISHDGGMAVAVVIFERRESV